jgi:hypothetical protein
MDLLITYTHYSELQLITALSLISTLYKSLQHPLSVLSHSVTVLASRCLVTDVNNAFSSASMPKSRKELLSTELDCQSESYITTGGFPQISSSWRQVP